MAAPFHIIDGYNLLHAAGLGRPTYGPGDLQRVRNRLLSHLRTHLAAAERAGCTRVYSEDLSDGQDYDGVTVLNPFSPPD